MPNKQCENVLMPLRLRIMNENNHTLTLNEQRQLVSDGVDFVSSFCEKIEGVDVLDTINDRCEIEVQLAQVTLALAFLLRENHCGWKELPVSWSISKILAIECFKYPSDKDFSWDDLPESLKEDTDIVLKGISNQCIKKWEEIPTLVRNNEEIAFTAWKSILRWREEYFTNLTDHCPILNHDFFRKCIEQEKIHDWNDLPQEYRTDIHFARSLTSFPSKSIAYCVLDEFSELCEERETWEKVMKSTSIEHYVGSLLELFAPTSIISDRSLMLQACKFDSVLRSVAESLGHDRSFVTEVLRKYPSQVLFLEHEAQFMFPDLVLSTLRPFCDLNLPCYTMRKLVDTLHHTFWNERENVKAWFRAGLPHPHLLQQQRKVLRDEYSYDEEVILLIAAYCRKVYREESFALIISKTLRGQKKFMKKAMDFDPKLIVCADTELQQEFGIVLEALGKCKDVFDFYTEKHSDYLPKFFEIVRMRLSLYHLYINVFLVGIDHPECDLSMLGRGTETTISFKKCIAEYLDVPMGEELRLLRQCSVYIN